ncbi:unnamed protein product [Prunus armeniaca]
MGRVMLESAHKWLYELYVSFPAWLASLNHFPSKSSSSRPKKRWAIRHLSSHGASQEINESKKDRKLKKNLSLLVPVEPKAADSDWWDSFFNPRVSKKNFDHICSLVREDLVSRPPSGLINVEGRLLSVVRQVAIALRRLASGESQVSVGAAFGVGQPTVFEVTWRVIEALEERCNICDQGTFVCGKAKDFCSWKPSEFDGLLYRNVEQYPNASNVPGILILEIDAPIYFANTNYLREWY